MELQSRYPDVTIPDVSCTTFITNKGRLAPTRTALIDGITGKVVTYEELERSVRVLGGAFRSRGLRQGDVVCICAPNSVEFSLILLAVPECGATLTTINPASTPREILHQINDSKPVVLITVPEAINKFKVVQRDYNFKDTIVIGEAEGYTSLSTLLRESVIIQPGSVPSPRDRIAMLLYSSGTTGLPKGVKLTHRNIISMVITSSHPALTHYHDRDISVVIFPMYHAGGSIVTLFTILFNLGTAILFPSFNMEDLLSAIQNYKVTTLTLVPPIGLRLANDPIVARYNLSSLQRILFTGAPFSSQLCIALSKRLEIKDIRQAHGMTETAGLTTQIPLGQESNYGSVGQLLPNYTAKIVDVQTGKALPQGMSGELWLRGPTIMAGYLNRPDATMETIDREGWLHTGDIGYIDKEGYVFIVDRAKELIKYKAFQVPPAELEGLLISHPAVGDAAVVGIPDVSAGELPRAYVTLKPETYCSSEELVSYVAERVAPYKRLRGGVVFVRAIPKSPSGKILRRLLRDRARATTTSKL